MGSSDERRSETVARRGDSRPCEVATPHPPHIYGLTSGMGPLRCPGSQATEPTADQLEAVFYAALQAKDFDGVIAALQVMIGVDSARALRLHEALQDAIGLVNMLDRLAANGRRPDDG